MNSTNVLENFINYCWYHIENQRPNVSTNHLDIYCQSLSISFLTSYISFTVGALIVLLNACNLATFCCLMPKLLQQKNSNYIFFHQALVDSLVGVDALLLAVYFYPPAWNVALYAKFIKVFHFVNISLVGTQLFTPSIFREVSCYRIFVPAQEIHKWTKD